jgi:hypothetical protein
MLSLVLAAAAVLVPFDPATRAALPTATATLTAHGSNQQCSGVWLRDLLVRAGVPSGDTVRGPALAMTVSAEAADGYRVVFCLGELDAKLGKAPILVADRCDGKALPDGDGPVRLVAQGELRAARSVKQLVKIVVSPAD